jgi:hypothetical protein
MKAVKRPKCPLPYDNEKNTKKNAARRRVWKSYYDSFSLPNNIRDYRIVTREQSRKQELFVITKLGQMTHEERLDYIEVKTLVDVAMKSEVSEYWIMMNYQTIRHCFLKVLEVEEKICNNLEDIISDSNCTLYQ